MLNLTGQEIVNTLLTPNFRPFFARVVVLVPESSPSTSSNAHIVDRGAEVHEIPTHDVNNARAAYEQCLAGVDVVIDTVEDDEDGGVRDILVDTALKCDVRVFFPNTFYV